MDEITEVRCANCTVPLGRAVGSRCCWQPSREARRSPPAGPALGCSRWTGSAGAEVGHVCATTCPPRNAKASPRPGPVIQDGSSVDSFSFRRGRRQVRLACSGRLAISFCSRALPCGAPSQGGSCREGVPEELSAAMALSFEPAGMRRNRCRTSTRPSAVAQATARFSWSQNR